MLIADEAHARDPFGDHPVDGVAAAAAHTDDPDRPRLRSTPPAEPAGTLQEQTECEEAAQHDGGDQDDSLGNVVHGRV